jgi:glycerol-3-phosphate acyltransferase PlsY
MLGLFPYFTYPGLTMMGVFIVVFFLFRYISLASIVSAGLFPVADWGYARWLGWDALGAQLPLMIVAIVIAVLIVLKHRSNIARLIKGVEPKFGQRPTG